MSGPGPVARLFASLANVLFDVGLPTMRAWLRERLGPAADVEQVTTDGELVHLEGVRLPVGPRGFVLLERASARLVGTSFQLHAFRGAVRFGDDAAFVADVEFASAPQPEEDAWIAGELTITRATWSTGGPPPNMHGRARLVVTSKDARLEGGELVGEQARARFDAEGSVEGGKAPTEAVRSVSLTLERSRVGPFLDVASAVLGRAIAVPPGVPVDAQLDGTLGFRGGEGGACNLHISAEGLRLDVTAAVGADAKDLRARVTGTVAPASALARAGVGAALRPREEDVVAIALEAFGDASRPTVRGSLTASALGFRFGRPRFVPPLVASDVALAIDAGQDGVVHAKLGAKLGAGSLAVDGAIPTRTSAERHAVVRLEALDASWIAAIATAAGAPIRLEGEGGGRFSVPRDAHARAVVTVAWKDGGPGASGAIDLATPRSYVRLDPFVVEAARMQDTRIFGELAFADALTAGLFPWDIRPTAAGAASVDLVLGGPLRALVLRGRLASPRVALVIAPSPSLGPFVFSDVDASMELGPDAFRYEKVRFAGYGGAFTAEGVVPLQSRERPVGDEHARLRGVPVLALGARDVDVSFVESALAIARVELAARGVAFDRELCVPPALRTSIVLRLFERGALAAHAALVTPTGTAIGVTLAPDDGIVVAALAADFAGVVAGKRAAAAQDVGHDEPTRAGPLAGPVGPPAGGALAIRGAVAIGDVLLVAGVSGPVVADGIVRVDASQDRARVTAGAVFVDRLVVSFPGRERAPSFELHDVSALFCFDSKLVWHRLEARAYGGAIASSGLASGATLQATVALRDVRAEDVPLDPARKLGEAVYGRLGGELRVDRVAYGFFGRGEMRLLDGAFPALRLARAPLARYGLTPPPELAIAPATATIDLAPSGVRLGAITAAVRGLSAEGAVQIGADGALDGDVVVTIGEEFLRSSAVLVLPAALTEHLTLPVAISGTAASPIVHADLGALLGRFAVENRVADFVTNVVEVITGRAAEARSERTPSAPPSEEYPVTGDALANALVEHAARWDALEAHRTRCRG